MQIPAADRIIERGDNRPPLITTEDLEWDNQPLFDRIWAAEELVNGLPEQIDDDETNGVWQDKIPGVNTLLKDIESARVSTKAPYLTANATIDGFFKETLAERVQAVYKALNGVVGDYLQRKRDAERIRREMEARRLREEQAAREAEARRLRAEAEEAALAARLKAEAEADTARRAAAMAAASQAQAESEAKAKTAEAQALASSAKAAEAEQSAQAKSADMARTRSAGGSLGTLVDKWNFRIDDVDKLKGAPLWPYIDRAAKEKAIRAYMTANAPKTLAPNEVWQPLDGVTFYREAKAQVRG